MKREKRLIDERREQIVDLVKQNGMISIEELALQFDTSAMTIRRDIRELEQEGILVRNYGGLITLQSDAQRTAGSAASDPAAGESASPIEDSAADPAVRDLQAAQTGIARFAATLLSKGEMVFANSCSTAIEMLRYISQPDVRVCTNYAAIAADAQRLPCEIELTGGQLDKESGALCGNDTYRSIAQRHAAKAFIGLYGIASDGTISVHDPAQIAINEMMISHSREYFILADHSKAGKLGTYVVDAAGKKGTVLTDPMADPEVLEKLRSQGFHVIVVDDEGEIVA